MLEPKELSRRNFMQTAIWGVGGLIGIVFGASAVAYIVGPSLKKQQTETWVRTWPYLKGRAGCAYPLHLYRSNPNWLD